MPVSDGIKHQTASFRPGTLVIEATEREATLLAALVTKLTPLILQPSPRRPDLYNDLAHRQRSVGVEALVPIGNEKTSGQVHNTDRRKAVTTFDGLAEALDLVRPVRHVQEIHDLREAHDPRREFRQCRIEAVGVVGRPAAITARAFSQHIGELYARPGWVARRFVLAAAERSDIGEHRRDVPRRDLAQTAVVPERAGPL